MTTASKNKKGFSKKAQAQDILKKICPAVQFVPTKVRDRIICSFPSELLTENAKDELAKIKESSGIRTYEALKNKKRSFYIDYSKINVEYEHTIEPEQSLIQAATYTQSVTDEVVPTETAPELTPDERFLHEMRHLGIGVKAEESGVSFYSDDHKEIFESVFGKFTQGKRLSHDSEKKIKALLGEAKDDSVLINDLCFAEWILKAEKMKFECAVDIVTEDRHGNKLHRPRTTPFIFKKKSEAHAAFNLLKAIGLNPEWQPKEELNFWLIQRELKKRKPTVREKMHPITKALQELGVPGHEKDGQYWSQNSVKKGYCSLMHRTNGEDERLSFALEIKAKLEEKLPDYEISVTGKGIRYKKIENQNNSQREILSSENPEEKEFLRMFTKEMWQHILKNAPEEIVSEIFHKTEDDKHKKVLDKIQTEYVLVNRNNPMIPGIKAMKPEDVKDVYDFTI